MKIPDFIPPKEPYTAFKTWADSHENKEIGIMAATEHDFNTKHPVLISNAAPKGLILTREQAMAFFDLVPREDAETVTQFYWEEQGAKGTNFDETLKIAKQSNEGF